MADIHPLMAKMAHESKVAYSPDARERWSPEHGHCACGDPGQHAPHMCEQAATVVLRCKCGDPASHTGEVCPEAVIHPLGTHPDGSLYDPAKDPNA